MLHSTRKKWALLYARKMIKNKRENKLSFLNNSCGFCWAIFGFFYSPSAPVDIFFLKEKPNLLKMFEMGLVRITSWYPNFNGSHFGLPPSEIHRMTGLPLKIVWTMTYSHRPHFKKFVCWYWGRKKKIIFQFSSMVCYNVLCISMKQYRFFIAQERVLENSHTITKPGKVR